MGKRMILAISILWIFISCREQQPTGGYTINGEIAGLTNRVYLTVFEGKMPYRIDSTEIINGVFTFTGDRPVPILAAVESANAPLVRFFLENAPIHITGSADQPQQITVTGSQTQNLYQQYALLRDSLDNRLCNDSILLSNTLIADSLEKEFQQLKLQFVQQHAGSVVSAYVLFRELAYDLPAQTLRQTVERFDPSVRTSVYAELVTNMANALDKTAVGQKYTNLTVPDTLGQAISLSEFVGPDKYVLVDFWASWAPLCRTEQANLMAAYKIYHPRGLEIYAVSLDQTKEAWMRTIHTLSLPWIHVSDLTYWQSQAADLYGIRSIPANILIGPDSTILARNLRGESLIGNLSTYLGPVWRLKQPSASDSIPTVSIPESSPMPQ